MFTGVTRRCHQIPSSSLRVSIRLLHHSFKSRGGGSNHSHSSHSHSSSSSTYSWRIRGWRPFATALAATAFSFKDHGISEEKVRKSQGEEDYDESHLMREGWEMLYEESNLHVYRRRKEGFKYETYEYRCQGSYKDISPRHFLAVQNDVSYRAEWDKNVIKLELVKDDGQDEQLIRWVTRYPYPLYPREYVYVKRNVVSEEGKDIVIQSKALPQSVVPLSGNYVRVESYESRMCVRCHKDYDSPGLDYVLTYFDNPEANIPSYAYNWIVNQAGPYFIKQVYVEARKLANSGRHVESTIRMKCPFPPAETETSDEDEETRGGEEEEEKKERRREPQNVESIPGVRLIPSGGEGGPMKRGAEREGEMEERKEEEKEKEEEEWNAFDDQIPYCPLPGRRIFV
ncbi:hypothetical protein PMAYCL1PPCAC_29234 [Pristionchus mayeri]|uniref:Phosphatidylcholine transfer protein n=1 Tax=Pristionchus mayeri TaxID=1317129 RepID=A0AAN5IBY5_9BILA|nr:hypothetical protein PMAYCL1PPCAC_29234 [Pristionchus mayeri]